MNFSLFLAAICGIPFLVLVLLITLLLASLDCALKDGQSLTACLSLLDRIFRYVFFGGDRQGYLYSACFLLILVFLFIPMGSLRSYAGTNRDMLVIILFIAAAQSFYVRGVKHASTDMYQKLDDTEHSEILVFCFYYIAAVGTLAWYMLNRGMPGNVFSLESLSAMPIWTVAGRWGKMGLASFFLLSALTSPGRRSKLMMSCAESPLPELYGTIRSSLCPAVAVAMLVPWNPAILFGLYGLDMFVCDFIFFWMKVFVLQAFIFPQIRRYHDRIIKKLHLRQKNFVKTVLGVAGVVFLIADLYIRH